MAGGTVYPLPLRADRGFLPDLQAIPTDVLAKTRILWLNYPNNPTGAIAPMSFFEEAVAFAQTHGLMIAHDTPYVDVCFDGYKAPSLLEVPGAKAVAVEFNSLSKAYNMAGWRLGMAVGNPQVIGYLEKYKSQVDTSHFEPILAAGITALTGDQTWLAGRNAIYQERRDAVLEGLASTQLRAPTPEAALYVWAHLPAGVDDVDYCDRALQEAGVSMTPGSIYGPSGRGYVRMSICIPAEQIRQAFRQVTAWEQKQ